MSENRKKRKSIWLKRPLALLLALVMMITSVDMSVFATEATEITQAETSTEQEIETQVEESEEETAEVSTEEESEEEAAEVSTEEESEEEAAEVPTEEESEEEAAEVSTEEESEEETEEALTEEETAPTEEGEEETLTENEETLVEVPAQSSTSKTAKTMLASSDASTPDTVAEDSPTEIDVSSYGDSTVYIYSSLYFSDAATGSKQTASGQGYVLKGTAKKSIEIGNQDDVTGGGKIEVSFNGLSTPELVITSITGDSGDKYAVEATVDATSSITALELEENAILNLTLNADLTIDSITLSEGSKLNIDTNGHTLTVKTLSAVSDADVSIKGTGTVKAEEISADTLDVTNTTLNVSGNITAATRLTFDSAYVTLNGGKITSEGEINVAGSTIKNAALLGFTATTIENKKTKTINVDGAVLENVTVVGAEADSNDFVTIEGTASTSGTTSLVQDYKISYEAAGVDLTVGEDWPIAYRVSNGTMIGYHTTKDGYVSAATVTLPTVTQEGYQYIGWTLAEKDITELSGEMSGDITLSAKLEPGTVIITWDLGYEPSNYTNDEPLPKKITTMESVVAGNVELTDKRPVRFGYKFDGWISDKGSVIDKDAAAYTVELKDLTKVDGQDNSYTMTLTAQWAEDNFPLVLFMGTDVASENIEISLDGGSKWAKVADVTNTWSFASFDTDGKAISFAVDKWITYNHNLGEHFTENGMSYPMLRDAGLTKKFESWKLNGADYAVTEETVYNLENGLLKNSNNQNLVDYQAELKSKPVTLEPVWGAMEYTLTTDTPAGWKILVDDTEVTPVNGELVIRTGKKVTYQCSKDSKTGISLWKFHRIIGENNKQQFAPAERTFVAGDLVLNYDFTMPACDVTAKHVTAENIWLNLHVSPITFEDSHIYNGLARDGFWYDEILEEMTYLHEDAVKGYFYMWDMKKSVQVTSGNMPTPNQLTLAEATTVYLKECVLVARDAYSTDFVDRKMGSIVLEKTNPSDGTSLIEYGNIVLDNDVINKYTTNLYFIGENTLATVFTDKYHTSNNLYGNRVNLYAVDENSKVNFGCVFGNASIYFYGLEVAQYSDTDYQSTYPDNSDYMMRLHSNNMSYQGCNVSAKDKRIYNGGAEFYVANYQGKATEVLVESISTNIFTIKEDSYVETINDLVAMGWWSCSVLGNSTLVVGGNLAKNGTRFEPTLTVNTTGAVIIKGNHFYPSVLKLISGTVVANAVMLSECEITGGVLITNLLMNLTHLATTNAEGYCTFGSAGNNTEVNGDNVFFKSYAPWDVDKGDGEKWYKFLGGEVYLLGYYEGDYSTGFNVNVTSKTEGNPIGTAVEALLLNDTSFDPKALVQSAKGSAKECFVLGKSDWQYGASHVRYFQFDGAEVYAAGNMTLLNETTISDGIIECAGKLSSKRDLIISGGAVTAKEIGNSYNLKGTLSDGCVYWNKTVISGGTVKTDYLGPVSTLASETKGVIPRSTIVFHAPVQPLTSGKKIKLVHDVYVNYIGDNNLYEEVPADNPENLRYVKELEATETSWESVNSITYCTDNLTASEKYTFISPTALDGDGAVWRLDALLGDIVTGVDVEGSLLDDKSAKLTDANGYAREVMRLYAAKDKYSLVIKEGTEWLDLTQAFEGNNPITFSGNSAKAAVGSQVQLTLKDNTMSDKVVVWYYDGQGILHNVMPVVTDGKITFNMPAANAEVFVTDDLSLYLNEYDILFTPNGFSIDLDANPETLDVASDTVYLYKGNLTVTQSNIIITGVDSKYTTGGAAGPGHGTVSVYSMKDLATGNEIPDKDKGNYAAKYVMEFASNSGNANETEGALKRDITLKNLNQHNSLISMGTTIPEGENVIFKVDGLVQLLGVNAGTNNWNNDRTVKFVGKNPRIEKITATDCPTDGIRIVEFYQAASGAPGSVNVSGELTFENLTIVAPDINITAKARDIVYDFCYINKAGHGSTSFAEATNTLTVKKSYIKMPSRDENKQNSSDGKLSVLFQNSEVEIVEGGSVAFFIRMRNVVLDNSKFTITCKNGVYVDSQLYRIAKKITLMNGSSMDISGRFDINELVLHDTSSVTVNAAPEGFLICPSITVHDQATVTADYILLSGFISNDKNSYSEFVKTLEAGTGIVDGKNYAGLVMYGGTVTANQFVGGDVNGKITVHDGTLTSNKIGTYGATFGHYRYYPAVDDEWVYRYERIPTSAAVTVNGGTVNVTKDGYLGGMNTAVAINGGTVNMADNTHIGLTDEEYAKLVEDSIANHKTLVPHTVVIGDDSDATTAKITGTASINVPKGSVTIKGSDTEVNVKDILASGGTITIEEANGLGGKLDNPYTGTDGVHDQVGVAVDGTLKAQNVTIQNGAIVYAKEAYAEAELGETGALNVTAGGDGNAPAYLYIGTGYGTLGSGDVAINIDNDNQEPETYSHVYGATYRKITYHLMDDEIDAATNPAENKKMFEFGSGEEIVLSDPLRHGYIFKGWYDNEEFTGDVITRIFTNANRDYDLYAKWEPKTVEFTIVVDGQSLGLTSLEELKGEVAGLEGTLDEANMTFTFKSTSTVAYLDTLLDAGKGHIDVNAYSLKTYSVKAMAIDDDSYNGGESETIAASAVVTRELLAAYEAKKVSDKNATIRVVITGKLKDNVLLTLDLNLDPVTDRPVGSKFNNTTAPDNHTATTISSYVAYGNTIAAANGFVDATGKMITASAPGYTFKGWYYKDASDNKVFINETFQITRDSAKTFYAEMIPNEYLVEFDAGENARVTADDEVPDNADGQKISGLVTYDTYINEGIDYAPGKINQPLPSAWKEGYVFVGWSYGNSGEMINDFTELNLTTIPGDYLNVNAESNETALTLKAVYRPVNVTYNLNGGKWNSTAATANPAYADALAGYTKKGDGIYEIISTSKDDFKVEDGQPVYVENDYRHVLGRKGYTFKGWIDKDGNEVKTTPKYEDIELTAQWDANTYTLQLNATNDELRDKRAFGHEDTSANPKVTVTVDERIAGAGVTAWPSRDKDGSDWYVQNLNDTSAAERYLLGFTFDALDPGDTRDDKPDYGIYQKYGANVNILTNNKTLFVKAEGEQTGSTFFLP